MGQPHMNWDTAPHYDLVHDELDGADDGNFDYRYDVEDVASAAVDDYEMPFGLIDFQPPMLFMTRG